MPSLKPRAKPKTDGNMHGKHESLRLISGYVQVGGGNITQSETAENVNTAVHKESNEINAGGAETVIYSETRSMVGNMSLMWKHLLATKPTTNFICMQNTASKKRK